LLNHGGTSNNTSICIDKSSNTISRRRDRYEANMPSNLVVTSKSYIAKTKAFMHNNKAMKGNTNKKTSHPKIGRRQVSISTRNKIK